MSKLILKEIIPIGNRILQHTGWTHEAKMTSEGGYYHYVDVCNILSKLKKDTEEKGRKFAVWAHEEGWTYWGAYDNKWHHLQSKEQTDIRTTEELWDEYKGSKDAYED